MDEAVIKYYRKLLKEDFPNAGQLEEPFMFIEAVGEKLINCGNTGNFMQLYFRVENGRISEICYNCACEPVANVAVEILCDFTKGQTLTAAAALTDEPFFQLLGTRSEAFGMKVRGLIGLLNEGIAKYFAQTGINTPGDQPRQSQGKKVSWDGTLST